MALPPPPRGLSRRGEWGADRSESVALHRPPQVQRQLRERCDAKCEAAALPFEVDGLEDLCARNPNIPKVYSKCELAGYKPAAEASRLRLDPIPRPKCRSVGKNVEFIASKEDGGTITCD